MTALRVQREPSRGGATLGALYLDDVFFCWTLEDMMREPPQWPERSQTRVEWVKSWKVPGQTAIPSGRYVVVMEYSPKFGLVLPELKDVPGYSETKFHAGNKADDTEGCIIVGLDRQPTTVSRSRVALTLLLAELKERRDESMFVDIINPPGFHRTTPGLTGERRA